MTNKFLLLLFFLMIFQTNSYSQKIKLRIDIGNSINFSSYRSKLHNELGYYQGPISTSEYTYTKLARCSLLNLPTNLGLLLEFEYKERNHFTAGFMLGEIISIKKRTIFNYETGEIDSNGYRTVAPWSKTEDIDYAINKINFTYSRDFGKGWLRFSPLVGFSYAWFESNAKPNEVTSIDYLDQGQDNMFPSSKFYIESIDTHTENTSTMMGSLGINFRVHSKKRELFALKLYYEQGFRAMMRNQTIVYRNSNKFIWNLMYSYGSAFYVKFSIPIPVYNFDKHRK